MATCLEILPGPEHFDFPHSERLTVTVPSSVFSKRELAAALPLVEAALDEDLADGTDLTCAAMVSDDDFAEIHVRTREPGIVAGLPIGELVFQQLAERMGPTRAAVWTTEVADGSAIEPDQIVARAIGPLDALLIGERTVLNFLGYLSGIATQTGRFAAEVTGTNATILDTRKTLPGWRILAKYAVRCGGGTNHRMGLYDGVLIKDNHLAAWSQQIGNSSLAEAIRQARSRSPEGISIEVEVDTLAQLRDVIEGRPDIVLLDNMPPDQLREAVALRNERAPQIQLEASGGVTLETVRTIAETGVDRISIGALTHSVTNLDLGFDFHRRHR
ncbi:carboxylating nicotinate-nucleotide diphosphorylase [bacterium]|nr:carboxylating nicotinate-nucleotide diphosphorylase [bacterium]